MIDRSVMSQLDLQDAVRTELTLRNRLLPQRWDHEALATRHEEVEAAIRPLVRRGPSGTRADVVLSNKGWRGVRPLHVMTLTDRVLYRALVAFVAKSLPPRVTERPSFNEFNQAPLAVRGTRYVSKTDVAAYYEYVDHDYLADELIGQTGEEIAVDALVRLLDGVMGRRIGLPQVHPCSDVLGDTYVDIARRRLRRRGYEVVTYSDDFRVASRTLGDARSALEACAQEVRELGLVLNERKTYTYGKQKYERSLTSFADAERELFNRDRDEAEDLDPFALGFPDFSYDEVSDEPGPTTLGATPIDRAIDEDEALADDVTSVEEGVDERRVAAARRAWEIWIAEDESEETQAGQSAAITQSLLGRALPTLGAAGEDAPLDSISDLLRYEPALAPQLASYIAAYSGTSSRARTKVRTALDEVVEENIFSAWQGMWLAQAAGMVVRARSEHGYERWLASAVADTTHDGLAATAAASLGRLARMHRSELPLTVVDLEAC